MQTLMGKRETYFTNTRSQAESLVEEMKQQHGVYLKDYTIAKRSKKDIEFFIITIVVEYYKIADLAITE